jgi:hypothetical protein
MEATLIDDFRSEFGRYRAMGERAMAQVPDAALNAVPAADANSIAMIVRHVGGNLVSRFTDFLTADGEKPDRHRDEEFEIRPYARAEVNAWWTRGWSVVEQQLAALSDADLGRTVTIRGQPLSVHAALCRSLAHTASHVGQLVLLGRMHAATWESLSIPRGQSEAYNRAPSSEKPPPRPV